MKAYNLSCTFSGYLFEDFASIYTNEIMHLELKDSLSICTVRVYKI